MVQTLQAATRASWPAPWWSSYTRCLRDSGSPWSCASSRAWTTTRWPPLWAAHRRQPGPTYTRASARCAPASPRWTMREDRCLEEEDFLALLAGDQSPEFWRDHLRGCLECRELVTAQEPLRHALENPASQ